MSDFLVVVPVGWEEVPSGWIGESNSIEEVNYMISQEAWGDIEAVLITASAVPEGKHILGAKLVTLQDGHHLWVIFG